MGKLFQISLIIPSFILLTEAKIWFINKKRNKNMMNYSAYLVIYLYFFFPWCHFPLILTFHSKSNRLLGFYRKKSPIVFPFGHTGGMDGPEQWVDFFFIFKFEVFGKTFFVYFSFICVGRFLFVSVVLTFSK